MVSIDGTSNPSEKDQINPDISVSVETVRQTKEEKPKERDVFLALI